MALICPTLQCQEAPSILIPLFMIPSSDPKTLMGSPNAACFLVFALHYTNRSFIYPLRMRGGKPVPLIVFLSALFFCLYNGTMQV